jgi:GDP-4-dehydro-6-deoxy-D-mannose reductase
VSVALITGGHGYVGSHLQVELRSRGWDVVAPGHRPDSAGGRTLDVSDVTAVAACVDEVRPDVVFHLAATHTLEAGRTVADVVEQTVAASRGLGLGLRQAGRSAVRVVHAGSSAQYGAIPVEHNPVTETTAPTPANAYGFAKLAAESVLCGLAADGTFEVIPARAFNHIGPGERATTVSGAFAARIRDVLAGQASRVAAADLEAVRDFTDVRDIARGYVDLAERGVAGRVYNLCSGRPTTVGDVLDALLMAAGLDRSVVDVTPTAVGARGGRISYQVGSPERARQEIGWAATIGLEQSAKDLLEGLA